MAGLGYIQQKNKVTVHALWLFNRDPERILRGSGRTNLSNFPAKFAAASGEP
jgi:hypothetical protein